MLERRERRGNKDTIISTREKNNEERVNNRAETVMSYCKTVTDDKKNRK